MKIIKCRVNLRVQGRRINKKLTLTSLFCTFFRTSSVYILSQIGKSKTQTRKIFWLVIFIIGLAGCLFQICQFLVSYYSYGVVVNLESIKPNYVVFPAVTICNINSFRREFELCVKEIQNYHECFGLNTTDKSKIYKNDNITLPECIFPMDQIQNYNRSKFDWIYLLMSQKRTSRIKYGHQFEDLVRACVFNGKNCDSNDFKLSVSHLYGNCYTFNSREGKYISTRSGAAHGLVLELDLEVDKYLTFTQTEGARLQIHDPHSEHSMDLKGIFLSPGYETNIAVTKSIISRLPSPFKDHCRKYKLGGSQENCRDLCLNNALTSKCGCTTLRYFNTGIRQCDLTDPLILCCILMVGNRKYSCNCPLPCEETVYNMQLSSSLWPTKSYYENNKNLFIQRNKNSTLLPYDKLRDTRLRVRVFYDTLDYSVYRQIPMYQSSEIFSQIGGQMGLWLGMSWMFIFECLECVIAFCSRILSTLKRLSS